MKTYEMHFRLILYNKRKSINNKIEWRPRLGIEEKTWKKWRLEMKTSNGNV